MNNLAQMSTNFLADKLSISGTDKEKLLYGFKILYINSLKTIILLLVAFFLNIIFETVTFILIYGLIRSFAFGVHLNNSVGCTIYGIVAFLGSIYLSMNLNINIYLYFFLFLANLIIYIKYAPAETKKRHINEKLNKQLKIKTISCILFLALVSFFISNIVYKNLILFAVVLEAFQLLPITYKIFKEEGKK
jgi:accessory gene regulator B